MSSESAPRSGSLRLLGQRLSHASVLTEEMRQGLLAGDEERIDAATARLQTVAAECRLLADEIGRGAEASGREDAEADWPAAHREFETVATDLARQSAIHGGLLVGLLRLSQRLLETLAEARGETYSRSGRAHQPAFEGLRLEERA